MSDVVSTRTDADGPPARGAWLKDRVGTLSKQTRQRWLQNAGLDQYAAREALNAPQINASDWGFVKLPPLDSLFTSIENGHESPFMDRLLSSRTFHSPDCSEAMAELLHVSRALQGLQGSAFLPHKTQESRDAVKELRSSLKMRIKAAWSQEAVRRGIASAKSGDQETALQTYDRALELDRGNVDAYVARGAAFANQRDFSRAIADFETALEIDPEHANAAKYLTAVRAQTAHLSINAAPCSRPATTRLVQASPSHHAADATTDSSNRAATQAGREAPPDDSRAPIKPGPGAEALERASSPASSSGPDEQLNIQKALQIVSEHYGKRKATSSLWSRSTKRRQSEGDDSHRKEKRRRSKHRDGSESPEEARSNKKKKKAKDKGKSRRKSSRL